MSFGGFKKQFHKASQFVSEKVGGDDNKTKMDEDFIEMEKKVDVIANAVNEIVKNTKEYLQPNPTIRARMNMMSISTKIQGRTKPARYPQIESILADTMHKYGEELGFESNFGTAMSQVGDSFRQLSEIKDSLDVGVKQDFLDPLQQLVDKDIKEVMHHRKKLSGRRLDYDYKRGKGSKVPSEELQTAEEKLEESLHLSYNSMMNLLDGDVEQVSQLSSFVEAQLEYHRMSADILESLKEKLVKQIQDINQSPRKERLNVPSFRSSNNSPAVTPSSTPKIANDPLPPIPASRPKVPEQPSCKASYDFEAENEGELGFKEGEILTLVSKIDENWLEGMNAAGTVGYFPESFVEILVPL